MDKEQIKKDETIDKAMPGFNGNFDTLIPTEEECDKAAEKCMSAYRALTKYRKYGGGKKDVKEEEKE